MNPFFPMTGSEADWNAAYYRLEDYFRALRVINKVHQSQVIIHLLEKAAARHARDTTANPTTLAMEEARAAMDQWFEDILGPRERLAAVGVISLLAVDAAARWPMAFLSDNVPAEFRHQMHESHVRAGPDLQVSSMVPRPIDVAPLLQTFNLSEAFEKVRWSMAIIAVATLAALSLSIFFLMQ